jgi:hypothetical protein
VADWVHKSGGKESAERAILERPIGDDPEELRTLNPNLNIWDAYANIHLLMPDGSMKLDGEAVAEVLRDLPNTRWFAWSFSVSILGFRPFQLVLNLCYQILSDLRPLFGCESCGIPSPWVRAVQWPLHWLKRTFGKSDQKPARHFAARAPKGNRESWSPRFAVDPVIDSVTEI